MCKKGRTSHFAAQRYDVMHDFLGISHAACAQPSRGGVGLEVEKGLRPTPADPVFQWPSIRGRGDGDCKVKRPMTVVQQTFIEWCIGYMKFQLGDAMSVGLMSLDDALWSALERGRYGFLSGDMIEIGRRVFPDAPNAFLIVKNVIDRRTDGRPKAAEPLEVFAMELGMLGYAAFRLWWTQMVAEFRQASTQNSSLAATVLSAALVEGALTFVVKHARSLNLGTMGSKSFDGPTTS
ncbi:MULTISPECIES: hypothetical protein [unclassified Burkholderia]|uniref:hypothetical protein n=1 Tax=unclassified Burkholderia TaxID=2613784 RepID=UPI001EF68DC8|nr:MULTISPECIES: hypothetical protein [unclassified Burkholderia]